MIDELFLPLKIDFVRPTIADLYNVTLSILSSAALFQVDRTTPQSLGRPALLTAAFAHVIFQWPMTLFGATFYKSLPNYWLMALSIHAVILGSLLYVHMVPAPAGRFAESAPNSDHERHASHVPALVSGLLVAAFALLTFYYISRIGPECTALYAMAFDPQSILLARELVGKIFPREGTAYVYGALINAVCPILLYVCAIKVRSALFRRKLWSGLAWFSLVPLVFAVVLLSGTKGNLLPAAIGVGVGLVASGGGAMVARLIMLASVFSVALVVMTLTEVAIDRGSKRTSGCYPLGGCAARHDACATTRQLITSLSARNMSLGIDHKRLPLLVRDLDANCAAIAGATPKLICSPEAYPDRGIVAAQTQAGSRSNESADAPSPQRPGLPKASAPAPTAGTPAEAGVPHPVRGGDAAMTLWARLQQTAVRATEFADSILYRAFAVPIQVGSWHFKYVSEYGQPGLRALPVARFVSDERIVMPIAVYDAYYAIFSSGDKTMTGTTPTSFILGYPAYLGLSGILVALAAIILFDVVCVYGLAQVPSHMRWPIAGLLAIVCYNFMASEFTTALGSHGGLFSILALYAIAIAYRTSRNART